MNIFELLRKDHEKVLDIFEELEAAGGEAARMQDKKQDKLFSRLKHELEIHMNGEEEVLYFSLRDEEETRAVTLVSYEEHHVVRLLLGELDRMPKDEYWVAKLAVLRENVAHHIDREEDDIFFEAQDLIDEETAKTMGKHLTEYKKAQGAHH